MPFNSNLGRVNSFIDYSSRIHPGKAIMASVVMGAGTSALVNIHPGAVAITAFSGVNALYLGSLNVCSSPEALKLGLTAGLGAGLSIPFKYAFPVNSGPSLANMALNGMIMSSFFYLLLRQANRLNEKFVTSPYFVINEIVSFFAMTLAGMIVFKMALGSNEGKSLIDVIHAENNSDWIVALAISGFLLMYHAHSHAKPRLDHVKSAYLADGMLRKYIFNAASLLSNIIAILRWSKINVVSSEQAIRIGVSIIALIMTWPSINSLENAFIYQGLKVTAETNDKCSVMLMDVVPEQIKPEDLRLKTMFTFVRSRDQLLLVRLSDMETKKVPLSNEKLSAIDELLQPAVEPRLISNADLEALDKIIGDSFSGHDYFTNYKLQKFAETRQLYNIAPALKRMKDCLSSSSSTSTAGSFMGRLKSYGEWGIVRGKFLNDIFGEGLNLIGSMSISIILVKYLLTGQAGDFDIAATIASVFCGLEIIGSLYKYMSIDQKKSVFGLVTYNVQLCASFINAIRFYLLAATYLLLQSFKAISNPDELIKAASIICGVSFALTIHQLYFASHQAATLEKENLSLEDKAQIAFGRKFFGSCLLNKAIVSQSEVPVDPVSGGIKPGMSTLEEIRVLNPLVTSPSPQP